MQSVGVPSGACMRRKGGVTHLNVRMPDETVTTIHQALYAIVTTKIIMQFRIMKMQAPGMAETCFYGRGLK